MHNSVIMVKMLFLNVAFNMAYSVIYTLCQEVCTVFTGLTQRGVPYNRSLIFGVTLEV